MKTAIYAGSFDPLTNGHLWMINQGLRMFDRLYVAIGSNPSKNYTFLRDERMKMLEDSIPSCERLTLSHFDNMYLVDYAQQVGAKYILRGIRNQNDYEYERVMRHINGDMAPDIITTILMPPRSMSEISSSIVKGLIGPEGWQEIVRLYVPPAVFEKLQELC
jgi:pantetheine-phosphate adenylyltransferase